MCGKGGQEDPPPRFPGWVIGALRRGHFPSVAVGGLHVLVPAHRSLALPGEPGMLQASGTGFYIGDSPVAVLPREVVTAAVPPTVLAGTPRQDHAVGTPGACVLPRDVPGPGWLLEWGETSWNWRAQGRHKSLLQQLVLKGAPRQLQGSVVFPEPSCAPLAWS